MKESELITQSLELQQLRAEIAGLRKDVNALTSALTMEMSKTMRAKDIEEMYGLAKGSAYTYNRIYLPNFGIRKGIDKHSMLWTKKEVLEWNSRSVEDRQREYDLLA